MQMYGWVLREFPSKKKSVVIQWPLFVRHKTEPEPIRIFMVHVMSYCPGVSLPVFWGAIPIMATFRMWMVMVNSVSANFSVQCTWLKGTSVGSGKSAWKMGSQDGCKWLGITPIYKLLILGHEWKGSHNSILSGRKWSPWFTTKPSTYHQLGCGPMFLGVLHGFNHLKGWEAWYRSSQF